MVSKELSQIRGTVIQRSFVPHDLAAVLNIATVPLSEVYSGVTETEDIGPTLRQVTSEILGIPNETIIDDRQYRKLRKLVRDGDLFRSYPPSHMRFLWREMFDEYLRSEKSFPTHKELKIDGSLNQFSKDSLCLLVSSHVGGIFPIFPFFAYPNLHIVTDSPDIRKLGLSSESFRAGVSCYYSGRFAEPKIMDVVKELHNYDIPLGQSPQTNSDSLLTLIEHGKKMCLAPMVAAGGFGISQLNQGDFVTALITVGTGSVMTLVLVGTLSVSDLLVRHMITRRPKATD